MVCFTHISRKNRNLGFLCKTELKPNRKWNRTNHSLSREQRPRKTKIGTEVAQVTHDSDTTLKVKRSRSPGRFTHRSGNVLAATLLLRCHLLGHREALRCSRGEERGGAYRGGRPSTACYRRFISNKCECTHQLWNAKSCAKIGLIHASTIHIQHHWRTWHSIE